MYYAVLRPNITHDIQYTFADIKTHGSESRGQEEAACTRVFWPT